MNDNNPRLFSLANFAQSEIFLKMQVNNQSQSKLIFQIIS